MISPTLGMAARFAAKTDHDWYGSTTLHPVGVAAVVGLGAWLLAASRRKALFPLMIMLCFVPSAQRIVILGADFTLLRILVLVGLFRVIVFSELRTVRFGLNDLLFCLWAVVGGVVYVIQQGNFGGVVYVCGTAIDMFGAYFVARSLIRTRADFRMFVQIAAMIALPVSLFFLIEMLTQRNLFSFLGGVPEITKVRDGRLRCQGAFSHPILAGVFWASLLPLFAGAFLAKHKRILHGAACFAGLAIIVACASSTPVLGFGCAIMFWAAWPGRRLMRYTFLAAPFVLVFLHLAMKAPVWHLVSRVTAVGGSTGHHRFVLIDGAINHFHEWWLVGTPWTGHWSEYFQTWDITNQYIYEGVRGGIWRLFLFLALVFVSARSIAKAQKAAPTKGDLYMLWGLGGSLFVHCACFIGVSYFGQIIYLWYMTLAVAAAAPSFAAARAPAAAPARAARAQTSPQSRRTDHDIDRHPGNARPAGAEHG